MKLVWNLLGIFVEIHGPTEYCGRPVWNFCGNYKEIWWKIQFHSMEFNVIFNKEFLPGSLTEHPVDHLEHFSVGICVTSYAGCW